MSQSTSSSSIRAEDKLFANNGFECVHVCSPGAHAWLIACGPEVGKRGSSDIFIHNPWSDSEINPGEGGREPEPVEFVCASGKVDD